MSEPGKQFDVIGLGVSTLDLMMLVDELPGEEMVQRAHESVLQGGGPIATAMVTLARLGSRTAMLDKIGDDWRGRLIVDEFNTENVSTENIRICAGCSSSIASVLVRKRDGARTIVFSPGNSGELHPDELPAEVIAASGILHLNGRHWDACIKAAQIASAHGVKVSFDGGAHRYRDDVHLLLELTDICIVAQQFAFVFSGVKDVDLAARVLLESGPEVVVVTAGIEGSRIFSKKGDDFHQSAFNVDPTVDTTGAGDAYHGAFLHGIVNGLNLPDCAALASAVAAMNTQKLGGRAAIPSLVHAKQFLAKRGCPVYY